MEISENWNLQRLLDFHERNDKITRTNLALLATRYALDGPWYGYGILSFQGFNHPSFDFVFANQGSHDIYLAVFGETGIFGFLVYLIILCIGLGRIYKGNIYTDERLIMSLMWISYLLIGLVWHNQFTSITGMVYAGLLYHIPQMTKIHAISRST